MVGWGPALVSVAMRRHCTVKLAHSWPRDLSGGCSGYAVMPGYPNRCVDTRNTFVCVMNATGAYDCPFYSDGGPPLRDKNGVTDSAGVLELDAPLAGTRATPPLPWQRRYPHVDSFIHPWTAGGTLRRGLTLRHTGFRGTCSRGTELTRDTSALRCVSHGLQFDPCYPQLRAWNHRGAIVACDVAPGSMSFTRFVLTRRS